MRIDAGDANPAASERAARDAERRARSVAEVMRSGLPELPRSSLTFGRFGVVEHEATGDFYRVMRGEIEDLKFTAATAFFVDANGDPVLLEPPAGGPRTRAELEEQRAQREQRRVERAAAPRPWAKR